MLGVYVSVPIACFRKGHAREYLETEVIPPPSTCYGFFLSLVGEMNRSRHIGCRVTATLFERPSPSVVLRTVWRVKKLPLGSAGNSKPDYQQLLTNIRAILWLDSTDEAPGGTGPRLEARVGEALTKPSQISRFGGLSLGESTHLVDVVSPWSEQLQAELGVSQGETFLLDNCGRFTLPVWVDHVGSAKTRFVTGNLHLTSLAPPALTTMPKIEPLP